jgi:MFS family permease
MANESGVGSRRYWIYAFICTLTIINYIDRSTLPLVAKEVATTFDLSPVSMGYLLSSMNWTYLLVLIPGGMICDRWGTKITIGVCIAFWSACAMAGGLANSFSVLLMTRLGLGLGEGPSYPTTGRIIREWAPLDERALATTLFNVGGYAGPAIAALLVTWIASEFGWRASFYATGALGFVWLAFWLVWYHVPERAAWLSQAERQKILTGRDAGPSGLIDARDQVGVVDLLRSPSMWALAFTQGCGVYSHYFLLSWLPSYLATTRGLTILNTGFYVTIPYAVATVLALALARVCDRALTAHQIRAGGRRIAVSISLLASSLILFAPAVNSITAIMIMITVSVTANATALSMNHTMTNDLLRVPSSAGKAYGILATGGNTFGLLAPVVTGYLIRGTGGYEMAFQIAGALLVMGAVVSFFFTRASIGTPTSECSAGESRVEAAT